MGLPDYQTEAQVAFMVVVVVHWQWIFKTVRSQDGRRNSQGISCAIPKWCTAVFSGFRDHIQLLEKCHSEWRSALL